MPDDRTIEELVILAAKRLSNRVFFDKRFNEALVKSEEWQEKAAQEYDLATAEDNEFQRYVDAIKNWGNS